MTMHELIFVNCDAKPKVQVIHCAKNSIPAIMQWYGAFYSGDRYSVKVDGAQVRKDANGELIGVLP